MFRVSAINGDGCRQVVYKLQDALDELKKSAPLPVLNTAAFDEHFSDEIDDNAEK